MCGGMLLQPKVVKGASLLGSEEKDFGSNEESLKGCTNVLKYVVLPWFVSNCIVQADLYFSSVLLGAGAKQLCLNGLQVIGVVVKTNLL